MQMSRTTAHRGLQGTRTLLVALLGLTLGACANRGPQPATVAQPVPVTPAVELVAVTHLPEAAAQLGEIPATTHVEPVMSAPADAWTRMRSGFSLQQVDHPRVQPQLAWYARNPAYLERVFKRAEPFLYHILTELERRGMPSEIALLPVVESAFDPFAYSHGRAAGMWQFIPGTGKRFGLKQNWWYDGRRDVLASTDAALDYLQMLHKTFKGDWLLALAAYNSGEGTVLKALRRNRKAGKATDFWHLKLPKETRVYVPKLLAISQLVADPGAHGIDLHPIANEARITSVDSGGQLDMAVAAKLAGMDLDALYRLNAGYNRWATDPKGPHRLVVPVDKADRLRAALAELPADQRVRWVRHKIRSGETLTHVAKRYHTTVAVLKQTNRIRGHNIRAGKHLLVPVATKKLDQYPLTANQRLAKTQQRARGGVKTTHVIRRGDTLWDLAKQYQVSVGKLAKWNGMAPGDTLRQGQRLAVWNQQASPNTVRPVHYTVRRGDSLARISQRFRVSVGDLVKWNGLAKNDYLQPGQKLKLYVDVTRQSSRSG